MRKTFALIGYLAYCLIFAFFTYKAYNVIPTMKFTLAFLGGGFCVAVGMIFMVPNRR